MLLRRQPVKRIAVSVCDTVFRVGAHTLMEPTVAPFFLSADTLKTCFPTRLSFMVHVRATDSSVWAVRISSQSFARVVECDMLLTVGNLSEAIGIDRLVAFFANDPVGKSMSNNFCHGVTSIVAYLD